MPKTPQRFVYSSNREHPGKRQALAFFFFFKGNINVKLRPSWHSAVAMEITSTCPLWQAAFTFSSTFFLLSPTQKLPHPLAFFAPLLFGTSKYMYICTHICIHRNQKKIRSKRRQLTVKCPRPNTQLPLVRWGGLCEQTANAQWIPVSFLLPPPPRFPGMAKTASLTLLLAQFSFIRTPQQIAFTLEKHPRGCLLRGTGSPQLRM